MDEYETDRLEQFGERGNPIFERETTTTDLDEMREKTVNKYSFCYCGEPLDRDSAYRCVSCELLCCSACRVRIHRRSFCHECARRAYGLDKEAFLTLFYIDNGFVSVDQLVEVTTTEAGDLVEIRIAEVARPLLTHGYITDDSTLTPLGQEALSVGFGLFGQDRDIKSAIRDATIQGVVG